VVLHAWVSAGRGTPSGRRGDEHVHALGSVEVGAADGMNIVPTRRAESAGASSMILSDSISVSDATRGDKTGRRSIMQW
jgi:hypothetical protein